MQYISLLMAVGSEDVSLRCVSDFLALLQQDGDL